MNTYQREVITIGDTDKEQSIYIEIGRRIKEEREALGFSQVDLAQEIGLTRTSIVNIETGRQRLPIHVLYRVATALGVPVNYLMLRHFPVFQESKRR